MLIRAAHADAVILHHSEVKFNASKTLLPPCLPNPATRVFRTSARLESSADSPHTTEWLIPAPVKRAVLHHGGSQGVGRFGPQGGADKGDPRETFRELFYAMPCHASTRLPLPNHPPKSPKPKRGSIGHFN